MSDYQIFSDYIPLANAGSTLTLTPGQTLDDGNTNLLQLQGAGAVTLKVEGPQLQLTPADIAGVYPAPNSEESPDEFLPHIALERRTLPWERIGLGGQKPWLALMLFKESELRGGLLTTSPAATLQAVTLADVEARDPAGYASLHTTLALPDSTPLSVLYVKNSILVGRRPAAADLKYMSHVRRDLKTGKDRAIVISNRLPSAGAVGSEPEIHTAVLVSLERRDDLYAAARALPANAQNEAVLVVLHHWSFKPNQGGDFEQVIRSIAIRPNGGVLRYGNLPKDAVGQAPPLSGPFQGSLRHDGYFLETLPHLQPGNVTWRGPLRPFAPPPRNQGFAVRAAPEEFENPQPDDPLDYSHASAFELGRLLALARPEVLEDLRAIHLSFPPIEPQVAVNKLPQALQKPDWVTNPAWTEEPWSMDINGQLESIVKDENQFLDKGVADVGGIAEQAGGWLNEVVVDLGTMAVPVAAPVTQIDIGTVTAEGLGEVFADVQNAGLG
jgi:hypothetical protein